MITLSLILLIVALVLAILSMFNVNSPFNLLAAAVILIAIALLIGQVH